MSQVRVQGLEKSYAGSPVIDGFSLDVAAGEFVTLLGPSGCGKSTTLRCVAGLEDPDRGTITIGTRVVADGGRASVPPRKRNVGLVFQSYALWPHMSVQRNVGYPLRARGLRGHEVTRRVAEKLELVGLAGFERRSPSSLSGGQAQRVALARALVGDPDVLLLDEPLSNLDAQRRVQLRAELRRIHREMGTTTLYVTHDHGEALTLSDRIVVMQAGVIEQIGSPREVFDAPASRFAAGFLGFENISHGRVVGRRGELLVVSVPAWGGELLARAGESHAVGAAVDVAVRASGLRPAPSPGDGSGQLKGRVTEIVFFGDGVELTLAARGGGALTMRLGSPDLLTDLPVAGAEIAVEASPVSAVVLAANGAAGEQPKQERL